MNIIFYLIQVMVVVSGATTYRGPAYLQWKMNPGGLAVQWSCADYGSIDVMICAVNAEQAQHDWLAAQVGVYQFPANLDQNLTQPQVTAVQNWLENQWIPGDWVTPGDTWRGVLRPVIQLFLYMQRTTAILGYAPDVQAISLNTQLSAIPAPIRDAMQQAATELGYDLSPVRLNWTLRRFLKYMADQWGSKPIYFGFTTL